MPHLPHFHGVMPRKESAMGMSQEKIDSYFASPEFPWLNRAVGNLRTQLDEIHVWRVDPDFVNTKHLTEKKIEVISVDDTAEVVDDVTVDDIRLLDSNGVEVDRVNQRLYYKMPVVWWNPWTWFKYSEQPYYCTQRPIWFFVETKDAKSIRGWLMLRSLPHVHFVLHFKPSTENAEKLSLVIRKIPKSKESRERMSLQMYIDFLIIQEQREDRLHREKLVNEVAAEIAAVDTEPNSD